MPSWPSTSPARTVRYLGGQAGAEYVHTWDAEQRVPFAQKPTAFIDRITDTLPKKVVRKVKNRWGNEIWQ